VSGCIRIGLVDLFFFCVVMRELGCWSWFLMSYTYLSIHIVTLRHVRAGEFVV
jgi:hypothetical protein